MDQTALLKIGRLGVSSDYPESVALAYQQLELRGYAEHNARPLNEWEHVAQRERTKLNKSFPGETRNRRTFLDKESVIRKYHQIYLAGKYPFGVPENFLTGEKVCAIIKDHDPA